MQDSLETSEEDTSQCIAKLLDSIGRFLDEKHIPNTEKARIAERLGETVAFETLLRVDNHLSEPEKEKFVSLLQQVAKNGSDESGTLQRFISEKFSEEAKSRIFSGAVENVLKEFSEKLRT